MPKNNLYKNLPTVKPTKSETTSAYIDPKYKLSHDDIVSRTHASNLEDARNSESYDFNLKAAHENINQVGSEIFMYQHKFPGKEYENDRFYNKYYLPKLRRAELQLKNAEGSQFKLAQNQFPFFYENVYNK